MTERPRPVPGSRPRRRRAGARRTTSPTGAAPPTAARGRPCCAGARRPWRPDRRRPPLTGVRHDVVMVDQSGEVRPGMLLVATPQLLDPNFVDTVVLMLDVDD